MATVLVENRRITDEEVAAAQRLWAAVEQRARASSETPPEERWRDLDNRKVFGELFPEAGVDRAFLETLRLEAAMFSGWSVRNLLGESIPSWTDSLASAFPSPPEGADWSVPAFLELVKEVPEEFVVRPPLVAGEAGYRVGSWLVNRDVVATQERTRILHAVGALGRLRQQSEPVVVEIGAGYGSLARHIAQCVPRARYVIVDLQPSLRFSGSYLLLALGADRVDVVEESTKLRPGTVTLVPAQCLDLVRELRIDLAINTMSFSEMPASTVERYGTWIRDHLATDGALFEQNHSAPEYQTRSTFCVPDQVLAPVFPWSETIATRALWGRSMLWANEKPSWFGRLARGRPHSRT